MLAVNEEEREKGRKAIHQDKITFAEWVRKQNVHAEADIGLLLMSHLYVDGANRYCYRRIDPLHEMDNTSERAETIHNTNVPLLSSLTD